MVGAWEWVDVQLEGRSVGFRSVKRELKGVWWEFRRSCAISQMVDLYSTEYKSVEVTCSVHCHNYSFASHLLVTRSDSGPMGHCHAEQQLTISPRSR